MKKLTTIELTKDEVSDIIREHFGISGYVEYKLTSQKVDPPLEFDAGRGCGDMNGFTETVFDSVIIHRVSEKTKKKWYQW